MREVGTSRMRAKGHSAMLLRAALPRAAPGRLARVLATAADASSAPPPSSPAPAAVKPIPGSSKLRTIYDYFFGGFDFANNGMGKYLLALRQRHGDIYKVQLLQGNPLVILQEPDLWMEVLRAEWQKPFGGAATLWPLIYYYHLKGIVVDNPVYIKNAPPMPVPPSGKQSFFALHQGGEQWRKGRFALQPELFRVQTIEGYVPILDEIAVDAVRFLEKNPQPNLNQFTMDLAFEMVAAVLLGKRLMLMADQADENTKKFVFHAQRAIATMGPLTMKAPKHGQKMPEFKLFLEDWEQVSNIGAILLTESEAKGEGVLARAAKADTEAHDRLLTNLTGLLAAGVDTTSSVFQSTIYALARYPHAQRKLREEILRVCGPPGTPITGEILRECHYLRAVSREVHRKHHVVNGNSRITDFEMTLSPGYVIPKETYVLFIMGMAEDPNYLLSDPELFLPERWLGRDGTYVKARMSSSEDKEEDGNMPNEGEKIGVVEDYVDLVLADTKPRRVDVVAPSKKIRHALFETPFGVGPRQCIGGRLATLEVHSFIAECMRHFSLGKPSAKTKHKQNLVRTIAPDPEIVFTKL